MAVGFPYLGDCQAVHEQPDGHASAGDQEQPQTGLGLVDASSSFGDLQDEVIVERPTEDGSKNGPDGRRKVHIAHADRAEVVRRERVQRGLGDGENG